MTNRKIHIYGGGTVQHISSHFALAAPAYGSTAVQLSGLCLRRWNDNGRRTIDVDVHFTKMCGGDMETNEDVSKHLDEVIADPLTKIIFMTCAFCDWTPKMLTYGNIDTDEHFTDVWKFGKYEQRLNSRKDTMMMNLEPTEKIISKIRKTRKDIFLVAFKTTCGATKQEMYEKGLRLCKEGSVNLVLVNDTKTRMNMIVTPEEATYHETTERWTALSNLVDMTYHRSHLTFTQSTVVSGNPVKWEDERVPASLRTVVEYCIEKNAYKPFKDATVGHFAVKLSDNQFLTSIRKSNFNKLKETGLVYVETDGPDTVVAYGAKPSVGGQSQRIVFKDHPGMDCIVHFHCPLREDAPDKVPTRSQREVECGSHECGKNTSNGLAAFGNLKAVYLESHGPNIVFNKDIDPQEVIDFIERNFDLSKKTGGYIPSNDKG